MTDLIHYVAYHEAGADCGSPDDPVTTTFDLDKVTCPACRVSVETAMMFRRRSSVPPASSVHV